MTKTESKNVSLCRKYGFTVGLRDPKVNPEFDGKYMVVSEDFAIVGNDLEELADETVTHFELQETV